MKAFQVLIPPFSLVSSYTSQPLSHRPPSALVFLLPEFTEQHPPLSFALAVSCAENILLLAAPQLPFFILPVSVQRSSIQRDLSSLSFLMQSLPYLLMFITSLFNFLCSIYLNTFYLLSFLPPSFPPPSLPPSLPSFLFL